MSASKTQSIVLSIDGNVFFMATFELLDRGLNVLHATRLPHLLAGEVAVKTSSVPVTWNRLWVEGDLGTELLGNAMEKKSGGPKVITH
jgi:hypothetical protein